MNLEGTWYVLATNFPMWTKGTRTRPRFIYSKVRSVKGAQVFDDTVAYEESGRTRTIVGVDTQQPDGSFVWRGRGWLAFFKSRWEIIAVSGDEQCLAISFTKTWATPAGIDVIARTDDLSAEAYASMLARVGNPELTRL